MRDQNQIMGLLKANEINKIKQKGIYSDGDGLRLRVDKNNNKNFDMINLSVITIISLNLFLI